MSAQARYYLVPAGGDGDGGAVEAALRARRHCAAGPPVQVQRCFYDSFDWALYLADASLEERTDDNGRVLIWHDLEVPGDLDSEPVASQPGLTTPGLIDSIDPGPVRERLAPLLGVRRLLPVIEVESAISVLRLCNDDDKTVARVQIEGHRFRDPADGREGPLATRLVLLPVRGYDEEFDATARLLGQELMLEPARVGLPAEALAAASRPPGGYSSKLDFRLDPRQRADATTRQVLRGLFDTLLANVPGTRANLDPEFLHDLRVATRRIRSALGQIKGVLPEAVVLDFKARFAWLQQVTGPVRDLDVWLLELPRLRERVPAVLRGDLAAFATYLNAHYADEQQRLAAALDGPEFAALVQDWQAMLDRPSPASPAPRNAARPIVAVADERIWRLFKRVRREGRAIDAAAPAEDLHELRKSAKKLRYLMEFFQDLYPRDQVRELIRRSKDLLDCLGSFQDLSVQVLHLGETAERMHAEGAAPVGTLLALGALIAALDRERLRAREGFAAVFAAIDDEAAFRALFGPGRDDGR